MPPSLQSYEEVSSSLPMKVVPKKNGVVNGASSLRLEESEKHDLVLRVFRCFIADLCEQFKGGHPGGAMGMAGIGIALWKYAMKYSPSNPNYFNRDRFVLSNGHTCLFQYTFMHLVGYSNMTLDQLRSYHSKRTDSICPGHPEIEIDGIEVTTGPLGQGVANAVGLAMAEKHLAATYNRPNYPVVDNMIFCMIGDACLQEGVALEAISLAGHWRLDNLVIVYDNNQVTCDGSVDLACNEDVNAKMRACGWNVIDVFNGSNNISGVTQALVTARASDKPTFINVRTVIGFGSKLAGDAKTHGAAFGPEDVANIKRTFGMDVDKHFYIPDDVYDFFHEARSRGQDYEWEWNALVDAYSQEYPELSAEFKSRVAGQMPQDWMKYIPAKDSFPTTPTASRKSAGLVCNPLAQNLNNIMVGTADLTPSVNMVWKNKKDFQHPDLKTACGINGDYSGRYIHWGIREHAMASISNGLAAYNKGTILPVTSTFFMFYIYAAAGVRMGALQGLQCIHVATHDSIGTGEDGPTHQPVELAALYRAMPNMLYIRPCDSEETAGAFIAALNAKNTPSIISLSRQNLEQYPAHSSREGVRKGAYVLMEQEDADVTLIGVGAEMCFAVSTKEVLEKEYGIKARVVSFPCQRLFEAQPREYKREVLQYGKGRPIVVIEAYAVNGWERYADAGFAMSSFGHSLPGAKCYDHFGFSGTKIAPKVKALVDEVRKEGIESLRGDFRDLNGALGFKTEH
ncbi:transketolase [Coniosporium apollinis CBS 100218]|uniref:transketolase n=1 Tax=Coniosporium apollinis (strain CBS 100218) TaxID=1168221 RepID=R7YR52_CONA1|nr:transketolase [Coniosporium apollinis CBS 100218]EON64397.1 transketolase [Coniosporium apollinis CBS 100218]